MENIKKTVKRKLTTGEIKEYSYTKNYYICTKEKTTCDCGATVGIYGLIKHKKTKSHFKKLNNKIN